MNIVDLKRWLRDIPKLCDCPGSNYPSKSDASSSCSPPRVAGTYRNPSGVLLKSLPIRQINAIIPYLLVDELGIWGVLALLPYTSADRYLVSILTTALSLYF